MRGNLYVALSGEVALQKRLDTIASNVANLNTAGFRADGVSFAEVLSKTGDHPTSFVSTGSNFISRATGSTTRTDNPFDVAIQGDAWFAIRTPAGTAYTRDGRMKMSATGQLQTLDGYSVLDAGRAAILLDPNESAPTISTDGMISQGGHQVGAIGLFAMDGATSLTRYDNSAVVPDKTPVAVLDFSRNNIQQGYSENSNVNPVLEMTRLIEVQRAFDGLVNASQASEGALQEAIKTLGSNS